MTRTSSRLSRGPQADEEQTQPYSPNARPTNVHHRTASFNRQHEEAGLIHPLVVQFSVMLQVTFNSPSPLIGVELAIFFPEFKHYRRSSTVATSPVQNGAVEEHRNDRKQGKVHYRFAAAFAEFYHQT